MKLHEISCGEVKDLLVLYGYGELTTAEEERVEAHLESCAECQAEQARQTAFLGALDRREDPLDASLLVACRSELRSRLAEEQAGGGGWLGKWAHRLREFSQVHIPFRVPVGAMALVAIGFFGARIAPVQLGGVRAGAADPMFSNVRSVEAGVGGNIEIAVDDVRRRVVSGKLQDPAIQELLLNAVREEANPGVRVESIGALRSGGADSDQVMRALVDAVSHDPDAGVRLKAIEGLKQYAGSAEVRRTLATVLLKDEDAGIREQAIDLLTAHQDPSIVGALQDAVQKEDNNYIRTRCQQLLHAMKASVGTF
jgi:HEAT repeats/Putative zinc-finger